MTKFTKSHEWVLIEDDNATIGITDYAQQELGDIVFVELPGVGTKVNQSDQFGTVESTKAASEIYAPLTGEVIAINETLETAPQTVNEDAQGQGWMIKVKIENPSEIESLLDEPAYKELIESESH